MTTFLQSLFYKKSSVFFVIIDIFLIFAKEQSY